MEIMDNKVFYNEFAHRKETVDGSWLQIAKSLPYEPYGFVIVAIRKKNSESDEFMTLYSNIEDYNNVSSTLAYARQNSERIAEMNKQTPPNE